MALWIGRRAIPAIWRRIPWKVAWLVAVWLVEKGRERIEGNLSERERHELVRLVRKSKGMPNTLEQRDRTRLKNIAGKAIRG